MIGEAGIVGEIHHSEQDTGTRIPRLHLLMQQIGQAIDHR
jgi:hypothetical protein